MLRRIPDRNIWVIYGAILLLGVAYGTSISVLSIHLAAHHIPETAMGWLATAFAMGIVGCSMPAGWLVKRIGARNTLLAALLGYAACVASFPYLRTLTLLTTARVLDGACSAGVWVSAETALLARAEKPHRAFVMSLYAMSLAVGYVIGPLLSAGIVRAWGTDGSFLVSGALAAVAAVVIAARLDPAHPAEDERADAAEDGQPPASAPSATSAATVLWRAKTSCLATFSYGYFQSSVVIFLPLYLIRAKAVPEERTILVTAFFAAGMLAMSTFVSRLGDRHGHLLVMRLLGALGGTMVASFVLLSSFAAMCAAVFVAGGTLASISPVSLALQGVVTDTRDLGRANAFYNASYAIGMILGPNVSGQLFEGRGGAAMLLHLAGMWAVFVALTVVFAADDPRGRSARTARARALS